MSPIDRSRIISVEAGAVPLAATAHKLWGDEVSGWVNDWIYVSSERIFQIVFSLPPGGSFRHSEQHRTVFGADELFYVLSGTLMLANPETGEVVRAEAGQAVTFGPNTWHHGVNAANDELRVLEFFAPPPATGSSQVYARTRPFLTEPTYVRDDLLERWPEAAEKTRASATIRAVIPDEILWRLEGTERPVPVGILLSTQELTVGVVELLPGTSTDARMHAGDLALYVLEGRVNVELPAGDGSAARWFELNAADGFFAPMGTPHRYRNVSDRPTRFLFGVAPTYLPDV